MSLDLNNHANINIWGWRCRRNSVCRACGLRGMGYDGMFRGADMTFSFLALAIVAMICFVGDGVGNGQTAFNALPGAIVDGIDSVAVVVVNRDHSSCGPHPPDRVVQVEEYIDICVLPALSALGLFERLRYPLSFSPDLQSQACTLDLQCQWRAVDTTY
ncbi:hypothetical protein HD806DRAFT_239673 [Xylariaceae sp. AK1471]|nr:hypothetical protein HD806DRAFT_239673 [Xylariaceae sp. AK1471]